MRVKVILNPYADNGRGTDQAQKIEAAARPFGGIDLVFTERPNHAVELAQEAAVAGYDIVAAAGGDGTISDVVNGLYLANKSDVKLGVIPIGSGNDLAWDLGISTDIETAVSRLFNGEIVKIDIGRIEDEYGRSRVFDNNLGIGFDATVVIETETITRLHGFLKYLLAVIRTIIFSYDTPHVHLQFDDEKREQETLFIAFGLGRRHGGGFFITPDAKHGDNLIDSCTVDPVNRLTMIRMLLSVMRGTHTTAKFVTMRQNETIVVQADRPLPIHVDGEMFAYPKDNVRQVTIQSLPAAIEVVV